MVYLGFETPFAVLVRLCYRKDLLFDEHGPKISVEHPFIKGRLYNNIKKHQILLIHYGN